MNSPQLSFIVPLYNEEENFPLLVKRLNAIMDTSNLSIEVVLVDDGSKDMTPTLMHSLALQDHRYQGVFLARNYGHQAALTAGLNAANATEAVMIIDGDLQDPPEMLATFYEQYKQGYDVVYGIRKKRKEGFLKRMSYHLFYRIQKKMSKVEMNLDSGDFSLISRKVLDIINSMPEESRYIRGMRAWVGFNQKGVEYERSARTQGQSKYSLGMLMKLAYNGIFNFSEIPIKFITSLGIISILASLIYMIITIARKYIYGDVPVGFTALLFTITMFGGVQLVSLGVIGEYIIRIFFQVKGRPLFIVKKKIANKQIIE